MDHPVKWVLYAQGEDFLHYNLVEGDHLLATMDREENQWHLLLADPDADLADLQRISDEEADLFLADPDACLMTLIL